MPPVDPPPAASPPADPPPVDPPGGGTPGSSSEPRGFADRYRSMPTWLQVLIPVVILALIGVAIWAIAGGGDDDTTADTTADTVTDESQLDLVLKGIVVGGLTPGESPTTTTSSTSTTATVAPTTVAPTTVPASVTPTEAPTVPPTTTPPTTVPPTAPPTTLPIPPGQLADTPQAFVDAWNAAAAGTTVPAIDTTDFFDVIEGSQADGYVVSLSQIGGPTLPPQVGLVGVVTKEDPRRLAQVLLVWIPGVDDAATASFYWEAYDVLVAAVDPSADAAALAASLGDADGPPFPAGTSNTASTAAVSYRLLVGNTPQNIEATVISAVQAQ